MKGKTNKIYGLLSHMKSRVLREYYSGIPKEDLRRRYGVSPRKLEEWIESYRSGKINIFDERDKHAIEMARKDDKEKIRQLESELRLLRETLKMSQIKVEGYEYMLELLKEEEGIDLLKKAGAGQSAGSGPGTGRSASGTCVDCSATAGRRTGKAVGGGIKKRSR